MRSVYVLIIPGAFNNMGYAYLGLSEWNYRMVKIHILMR